MAHHTNRITRRGLVGAIGGAIAGGSVLGTDLAGAATATGPRTAHGFPRPNAGTSAVRPSVVNALTPGLSHTVYNQFDFRASDPTIIGLQGNGFFSAPGSFAVASLALPLGTRVRELTVYGSNNSTYAMYFSLMSFALDGAGEEISEAFLTLPDGTDLGSPVSVDCDVTLVAGYSYSLVLGCYDETVGVGAVQVGYQNTGTYTPVTPYRCYDSRFDRAGRITTSSARTIDTTVAIDPSTGVPLESGLIPSGARAITFNLVAVSATGSNNFAITAGNVLSPGASHLAFSLQTPTVANAGTVDVDGGAVTVFGGGGSGAAHCILDVTGYFI